MEKYSIQAKFKSKFLVFWRFVNLYIPLTQWQNNDHQLIIYVAISYNNQIIIIMMRWPKIVMLFFWV